jgi:protein HOOK3
MCTICSLRAFADIDNQQPASHTGGFSENFAASVQLARSGSTQRFDCPAFRFNEQDIRISNMFHSDDYWKLYENYTGALKKIAEVQDTLETAKRDLSDTQAERKIFHCSGSTQLEEYM